MKILPTAQQMQKADQYTIEEIGIPSMVLMERAALSIVEVLIREEIDLSKVLILSGPGNNGGDGFAVARILHQRGVSVTVFFVGDKEKTSTDCDNQRSICEKLGIQIVDVCEESGFMWLMEQTADLNEIEAELAGHFDLESPSVHRALLPAKHISERNYTVIIDGIFGIGGSRSVPQGIEPIIMAVNMSTCWKIAIDIPTGVCASTGVIFGQSIKADLTIAIQCEKRGTVLFPGSSYAGKVIPVDIGIETTYIEDYGMLDPHKTNKLGINRRYIFGEEDLCFTHEVGDVRAFMPRRVANSHKGTYGKVLVIAGSEGMCGAATLAAKAAYTVGVGLVQVYTPLVNRTVIQTLLPEAIVTTYEEFDSEQLNHLLEWADGVCIGPGLGTSLIAEEILVHTLQNAKVPMVIDADGINLLKNHKTLLLEVENPCIITPHIKEMAHFLDCSVEDVKNNPIEILKDFVREYPAICVLKDARTLVGDGTLKDITFYLNTSGNSSMAKGGSGDVLAGVIIGLIANKHGLRPYDGTCFGVYLHGLGGDRARDKLGSNSVLARDIITGIQEVLAEHEKRL